MKFLEPHQKAYCSSRDSHRRWREWIHMQNERFQAAKPPSWVEIMVEPLAEEIARLVPGSEARVSGPSGIGAHVHISLYVEGTPEDAYPSHDEGWLGLVVLTPFDLSGEAGLRIVDLSVDTGAYAPGTIGELNGFNHPYVPLPDTVEALIEQYLRTGYEEDDTDE